MENDYFRAPHHKAYVFKILQEEGFRLDYNRALNEHYTDFYQVWVK
jgi:hypothetical protein